MDMNNNGFFTNNQMYNQGFYQNPMINQYNPFNNFNPNMNQNNNNMIFNNQMMNMNMNMDMMLNNMMLNNIQMNQNNINNNILNNGNIFNLDNDKLNLFISIFKFFKENNILCMNFEYSNQIKALLDLLNENYSGFKYENEVKSPLFYINEPKIIINFINSDYKVTKVNISKSITQYDLYTIANLYKNFFHSENILLIHKNKILNKDESSIDFISDNDNVIIIEPRYFPDDSYCKSLMKKSSNDFCNVDLTLYEGNKLYRTFPSDITIGEICKAFYLLIGANNYEYLFLKYGDGFRIDPNDKRKLKEFCHSLSIEERDKGGVGYHINVLGKQLNFVINSNEEHFTRYNYRIGMLNKIEDIIIYSEPIAGRRVKKIKIGEIEIKRDEDKRLSSLLSLGITKDFECQIEFGEKFIV